MVQRYIASNGEQSRGCKDEANRKKQAALMAEIRMDRAAEQARKAGDLTLSAAKRSVDWLGREVVPPARSALRRTGRGIERFGRRLWSGSR